MVKKKTATAPLGYSVLINLIFIVFFPIVLLLAVAFSITYILIHRYLKKKHGKFYGGLLPSGDALWKIEDNSRPLINTCFIVSANSSNPEDLISNLRTKLETGVANNPEMLSKFTSICRTFLGYGYLLKRHVTVADCFTVADTANITDEYLNKDTLTDFLSFYGNKALPKNNEALWEIIIIPKAIVWTDDVRKGTQFPVIWRCSHILGDGFTTFNQMLHVIGKGDDRYKKIFNECVRKILPKPRPRARDPMGKIQSILENTGKILYFCWSCAPVIAGQFLFNEADDNVLHGPDLTKDKHLVFAVEKKEHLMTAVRDIRHNMKGVSFSTVVFTGLSASLNNYFDKVSASCPGYISMVVIGMLMQPEEDGTLVGPDNKFSLGLFHLPVNTGPDMINRLEEVKRSVNSLASSPDFFVNHVIMNYLLAIIPIPLMRILYAPNKQTASISILPGLPEKIEADGFKIQDMIFHTPQKGKLGINVSILSYDNRFQLGLMADKRILPDVQDAQFIVDGILRHINKLHDAVMQYTS